MWNWRYMLHGLELNEFTDQALLSHFNQSQRAVVRLEPKEAFETLCRLLPAAINEAVTGRMEAAQKRWDAPLVKAREDNVVYANFGGQR